MQEMGGDPEISCSAAQDQTVFNLWHSLLRSEEGHDQSWATESSGPKDWFLMMEE